MAQMIKKVTLAPGEAKPAEFQFRPMEARVYQVSVDGLSGSFSVKEAPPPPALELIEAYFDNGSPMTKKPGDTFTVTLKIKNNLTKDWSPNNILYGFGVSPDPGSPETWSPIVWGRKPFTDEVWPEACGRYGKWPIPAWPIILAGTTKTFTTTYGLCPGAAGGIYDGIIRMDDDKAVQYVMHPAILTVVWLKPKLTLLAARLYDARWGPRRLGGYAIFGKVDVTITNNEGKTLTGQSPDYVDLQVTILRASDRGKCGFVRFSRDIPPGTNTITLDRTDKGWGVSEVTLSPGTFNYILKIKVVLLGWPGNPYVEAEFPGTTVLG